MFAIPQVGSRVRVTTRFNNIFYKTTKTQPFVEYVHEGVVLPCWKHDEMYTFNMTGSKDFPERNIALKNVVNLEILSGGKARLLEKNLEVKAYKVESKSKVYLVTKTDTKYTCTCIGFQYHRKCKHVTAVHAKVG